MFDIVNTRLCSSFYSDGVDCLLVAFRLDCHRWLAMVWSMMCDHNAVFFIRYSSGVCLIIYLFVFTVGAFLDRWERCRPCYLLVDVYGVVRSL